MQIPYLHNRSNAAPEHRDLNTWYTIHNDGNMIVFEHECIILSTKLTPDITKWQVTKPNTKSNDKTAGKQ